MVIITLFCLMLIVEPIKAQNSNQVDTVELVSSWIDSNLIPFDSSNPENYEEDSLDFMHLFFTSAQVLAKTVVKIKPCMKMGGMMWVSWPKGKSNIETDLNREIVRELVLKTGLVDIKVAAIDEDWSGLKFVYRKADRNQ